jgi:2'-5' RNA ligase
VRLFVAIPLPPEVAQAASRILPPARPLRAVKPELLHITLAFLGRVDDERVADASAAVTAAVRGMGAFEAVLDRAGRFPETGHPHFVWIGAGSGAEEIVAVGDRVRAELRTRALAFDEKPLRTHVTLARVRDDSDADDRRSVAAIVRGIDFAPIRFRVESVVLFESVLSPKGPRYTARTTARLGVGRK